MNGNFDILKMRLDRVRQFFSKLGKSSTPSLRNNNFQSLQNRNKLALEKEKKPLSDNLQFIIHEMNYVIILTKYYTAFFKHYEGRPAPNRSQKTR